MVVNVAAAYIVYFLPVVFGHIPVGCFWLYYTIANNMLDLCNVIGGIVYLALFIGLFMRKISYGTLSNTNSPYRFSKSERGRGGYAEKIEMLRKQQKMNGQGETR